MEKLIQTIGHLFNFFDHFRQIQFQNVRGCKSFPNPKLTAIDDVDLNAQPIIEIIKNPPQWQHVENILPRKTVPEPISKDAYPSGWSPSNPEANKHPYFIARTRNHMIPVYLEIDHRGLRRITRIKFISGDIWTLYHDVMGYIKDYLAKTERAQVNELNRQIVINGDYVNLIKDFLAKKGF